MATLKILSGSLAGQVIDLNVDPNFIGRASTNDVRIGDAGVSSRHAKIWCENNRWFVMDLGSTNGTLVNQADVDRETLEDGDKITFGTVVAVFNTAARQPVIAAPARAAPPRPAPPPPPQPAGPDPRSSELELELSTLQARYTTLEKELERVRQEAVENEKRIAESAVQNMKAEMAKLRDLMRERDESMRVVEAQAKEREAWFSPEEVERERKRVEAGAMLEARRQIEAYERQVKELEGRVVARQAEFEASQRALREKDELIRLLSEREDRAVQTVREKDDRIAELGAAIKKLEEEGAAAVAREKEANEKLRQKNQQLGELGQAQAALTQELARARAAAARVQSGDSAAAQEQHAALAAEAEQARQQVAQMRAKLNHMGEQLIGLNSAREQAEAKAAAGARQLEELQGQLTDLSDEKSRLESRVNELLARHTALAESERQLAGLQAENAQHKAAMEEARARVAGLEGEIVELKRHRLDLQGQLEAAAQKFSALEADHQVLRDARDRTFDWEARYKSQVEEFESMRKQNAELRATVEALEAQASRAPAGTVDDATLVYARSRTAVLQEMAGGMLEGINNAVSLLRRNSEVLKGYVHDCGLLANCVRQINYTLLEPDQQRMLRELIDETQPDVIIRNMESIGEENAEATTRGKRLILDYQEAMKEEADATDLERCFARSQGLVAAVDPGNQVRVKVSGALPPVPGAQPEAVLFTYALLREARTLAVDEDQMPAVRVEADKDALLLIVSPVHVRTKERYRETLAGGGDTRSRYIAGFARQVCNGRVDVKDMAEGAALFITLAAAK